MASSRSIIYQDIFIVLLLLSFRSLSSFAFIAIITKNTRYQFNHDVPIITSSTTKQQQQVLGVVKTPLGIDECNDDRLIDIRTALHKMKILQALKSRDDGDDDDDDNDDDDDDDDIMQDFQRRIQKIIECRESSIEGAGNGLFANKNIKAGTIIGFYPVHGIGVDFNDETTPSVCFGIAKEDQDYFDNEHDNDKKTNKANYIQYLIGSRRLGDSDFGPGAQLFVDVNPNRLIAEPSSSCWNGHYINDGATVVSNTEGGMLDYYSNSNQKKNCVHIPFASAPIIATVTTRKVKKGEELFTSYGCLYWAEALRMEDEAEKENYTAAANDDDAFEVTEAVQVQAKKTAQDIFTAWKKSQTIHISQQQQLDESFEKIR